MPKHVIERVMPNAGKLATPDLKAISPKSCSVLQILGPEIQWVESFVTDDKICCIYVAPKEEAIRKHAREGGFPANSIAAISYRSDNGRIVTNHRVTANQSSLVRV